MWAALYRTHGTWGNGVMKGGEGVTIMQYQIFVNNKLSFPSPHLTITNNELPVTRDTCVVQWPHITELSKDVVSLANLNFAGILPLQLSPCVHSSTPLLSLQPLQSSKLQFAIFRP